MPSINEVRVMGHLGREPEIRETSGGLLIANLSIATSYRPKNGDEKTEWHRVTVFGKMAEQVQGLGKGRLVYAEGRLQTRSYEKDGQTRYVTEIVANLCVPCEWRKGEEQKPPASDYDDQSIPF